VRVLHTPGHPTCRAACAESAGELYDSIHGKLLTLPGELEVYPAHFAGSACGAGISGKPSTTLAFERRNNPLLRSTRDAFIAAVADVPPKPAEMHAILRANRGPRGGDVVNAPRLGLRENLAQFSCWSSSTPSSAR
jgi:hydroxyacylglutathione hydrolase